MGESESDAKLEKHTPRNGYGEFGKEPSHSPSRKVIGANTARSTTVETITAKPSSRVPL